MEQEIVKPRIVFGVSCSHTMPCAFTKALFRFVDYNKEKFDIKVLIEEMYIIDEARNNIIFKALHMQERPDYVFFIDADNTFQYDTLEKLVEADKDIISGVYFQRHKPYYPIAFKKGSNGMARYFTEWKVGDIYEVDYVGVGCLLVKTGVLEKMKYPQFYVFRGEGWQHVSGEDIMFCTEVTKLGYKIWLHTGVNVGHIGGQCINMNDWLMFKNSGSYVVDCETGIEDITNMINRGVVKDDKL
jgi:hypothetical protein